MSWRFQGLPQIVDRLGNTLAYGVQRRLAVAVALMSDPQLLFLDEPAAGMNGRETADFIGLDREDRARPHHRHR